MMGNKLVSGEKNYWLIVLVVLVILPFVAHSPLLHHLAILVFLHIIISEAWNLIGGYAGQISLGNAVFFGLGAYIPALLYLKLGVNLWIGLLIGIAVSVGLSVVIGYICFRLHGVFFAFATLAVAEVFKLIFIIRKDITQGPMGITLPYRGESILEMSFASKLPYYYLALTFSILSILTVYCVSKSKLGYYLLAIREDETAAKSIGVNTVFVKIIAFILSAILNSIAGFLYITYIRYIDPYVAFGLNISLIQALLTIMGGAGTVWGPVLGTLVLIPLLELFRVYFATLSGVNYMLHGLLLMVIILLRPQGIISLVEGFKRWLKS
ncbi:MAG: branched-chain amino acid ABC transporter permease [Thermoprotei archaeon]|nr:MAG: amino acid ABC transporter permease [Desulfurococcales archaeon ex4484_217_2]RLG74484.1 MAG: branched-chain amino acid ABC transporter permease [Thermoprotei archaeon]